MSDSSSRPSEYSSLFTAGLFSQTSSAPLLPAPSLTSRARTPSISIQTPSSPMSKKKSEPSPLKRRKSSATIGSSPMAAIKSPAQRAQFAQRTAQRNTLLASPSRSGGFPLTGVPENRTLNRMRRGRAPPSQKPAPNAPLPDLPLLPFTESNTRRDPNLRRDSDTLPLPSPTLLTFSSRFSSLTTAAQSTMLAPSPNITNHLDLPKTSNRGRDAPIHDIRSSPILGSFDEEEECMETDI